MVLKMAIVSERIVKTQNEKFGVAKEIYKIRIENGQLDVVDFEKFLTKLLHVSFTNDF